MTYLKVEVIFCDTCGADIPLRFHQWKRVATHMCDDCKAERQKAARRQSKMRDYAYHLERRGLYERAVERGTLPIEAYHDWLAENRPGQEGVTWNKMEGIDRRKHRQDVLGQLLQGKTA